MNNNLLLPFINSPHYTHCYYRLLTLLLEYQTYYLDSNLQGSYSINSYRRLIMKYFCKLNILSILYALMVFVPIELMVNVYRISRVTNWEVGTVSMLTNVTLVIEIVGGTILLLFLTKKWLGVRKANFFTAILWIPYFVLLIYIFASLFPLTNRGDTPNPVTGFFVIGGLIVYPFYILILNLFCITNKKKEMQAGGKVYVKYQ